MVSAFTQTGDPLLLFSLGQGILLVNIILILILIGFAAVFFRHIAVTEAATKKLREEALQKALDITDEASEQARGIINEAGKKAETLLREASVISSDARERLATDLSQLSEEHRKRMAEASVKYVNEYQRMGATAEHEYQETLHTASQAMASEADKTVKLFEEFLKAQTVGYETAMQEKVSQMRHQADTYIEDYKIKKLKKVDEFIHRIILLVSRDVIGRALSIEEHNKLVVQALDHAKKEGFFEG